MCSVDDLLVCSIGGRIVAEEVSTLLPHTTHRRTVFCLFDGKCCVSHLSAPVHALFGRTPRCANNHPIAHPYTVCALGQYHQCIALPPTAVCLACVPVCLQASGFQGSRYIHGVHRILAEQEVSLQAESAASFSGRPKPAQA